LAQIHYSWDEVDRLCDYAIQTLKDKSYSPDVLVGITSGGAILGRIMATKMSCKFCPDYRRYSNSTYLEIPSDAKRILIVDDVMDFGGTIKRCTHDIKKKIDETSEIKSLIFCVTGAATFSPDFKLFDFSHQVFPWHSYEDPLKNIQFKQDLSQIGNTWINDIIDMINQLSSHTHYGCDEYYKKSLLEISVLEKFKDSEGEISFEIVLGTPLVFDDLISKLKDSDILLVEDGTPTRFELIDEKDKGNVFNASVDGLKLSLRFVLQSTRTFPQMCKLCPLRPKDMNEDYQKNMCITCNKTSRAIVSFEPIYDYLIDKNKLQQARLLINGVEELSDETIRKNIALRKLKSLA